MSAEARASGKNDSPGLTFGEELLATELPRALADPIFRQLEASLLYCDMSGHVWCEGHGFPVGKTRIAVLDVMYVSKQFIIKGSLDEKLPSYEVLKMLRE